MHVRMRKFLQIVISKSPPCKGQQELLLLYETTTPKTTPAAIYGHILGWIPVLDHECHFSLHIGQAYLLGMGTQHLAATVYEPHTHQSTKKTNTLWG